MPIVPLDPDVATSGPTPTSSSVTGSTAATENTGATDKVWKETPLDDLSRVGAFGAGPTAPDPSVTPAAPGSMVTATETSSAPNTAAIVPEHGALKESKDHDGSVSPRTSAPLNIAAGEPKGAWIHKAGHILSKADGVAGLVGEKPAHKLESNKPTEPLSPTSEEKSSKMSHLKEKLKDKLHIGSKDK